MSIKRRVHVQQGGYSLVELMVGIVIGMIIVGATLAVYVNVVRGGGDSLRSAKLNIEVRGAMGLIANEVRRAGSSLNVAANTTNPFTQANTNLNVPSGGCILFTYDRNGSGTVESAEYTGFKIEANEIKMRTAGASTSAGCSAVGDTWESVTDVSSVAIDTLTFTVTYQCLNAQTSLASATEACVAGQNVYDTAAAATGKSDLLEIRDVTISITGSHARDSVTEMSLTQSVRIRNDRLQTVGI